jgi:hypothetical protein
VFAEALCLFDQIVVDGEIYSSRQMLSRQEP